MSQPDEVVVIKISSDGDWYVATPDPFPPAPHGTATRYLTLKALPAAAYAALLTRVEAAEGALAQVVPDWLPESASDAEWAVRECADEIAVRLFRARLALRASGTREGA